MYFTVIVFVPGVVLSKPLTIFCVNDITFPVAPLAITSVILPPAKLKLSFILYSFLSGGVSLISFI